ncbi:hypothetical protein EV424DRAFT_1349961 [Suillus variegatus]|nr:hypothetical protein EV424DRAFT_1349961 [Suillus variegatus]
MNRHGCCQQNTNIPQVEVTPATPVLVAAAAATTTAAATIATTLHHPRRQQQLPQRFRQDNAADHPGDGKWININNVSGSEDDDDPPEVIAVANTNLFDTNTNLVGTNTNLANANTNTNPSPLQTATSTLPTNPFAKENEASRLLLISSFSSGRTQTQASVFAYHASE